MEVRVSEAKLQGRRLPNVLSSLRSLRRPCSGRTGPVPYFYWMEGGVRVCLEGFCAARGRSTGPPIAPRRTASAFLAAARASSVRGDPVASMEAWRFF